MREIIVPFTSTVSNHSIRVIGHERCDGIWEGVIEFRNESGRLVTGVETTQMTIGGFESWALGLQQIYLEGALRRAHQPGTRRNRQSQQRATL